MEITMDQLKLEFEALIREAYRISVEVGNEVEDALREGSERPLRTDEARRLLTKVIELLKTTAERRNDDGVRQALRGNVRQLADRIVELRDAIEQGRQPRATHEHRLVLQSHNGIDPKPVLPRPVFHGRDIPMTCGFVKTTDIELWPGNERLDLHLGQFRQRNGRDASAEELLDIMLSRMVLPGLSDSDQFKIVDLARSIAVNGVRKPPILDVNGVLLDGNRRVAACRYILHTDEFDSGQKARAEKLFVWQLTEHATEDDRNAVVVSLNFEPDCKQDWPEYVKARKVYEAWQAVITLEPRTPGPQRQAALKRELSTKFALGPDTSVVNRYLKMVEWAGDFEEYHINDNGRDLYEVKHRADRYFQYFDELSKGASPGGVAYALNQDDGFKRLVFDLLFDGKFRNWRQIRDLKFIHDNQEAREILERAKETTDTDAAKDHVDNSITIAQSRKAELRELGANTRIESFVKWLEELPVRAFRDKISPENLRRLLQALQLVQRQAETILGKASHEG